MNKKEFKKYIADHYSSNPNIKGIKVNGNEDYYVAKMDYGSFEECVIVCQSTDYKSYDMISLSYKIYNYKYIVSIYDLLALVEDNNYNVFTFKTLLSEDSLNEILDVYDDLTNRYYSYLKSLSNDESYQEKMTTLLTENLCIERFENEPDYKALKKEALSELTDIEASAYSSMIYVGKNDGKHSKTSVIKQLEKYEERLDVFEKQALNYLRNGGELPQPVLKLSKGSYRKYVLKSFGISLAIALIPAAYFVVRNIVEGEEIGYIAGIGSFGAFMLFMGIVMLFAKHILKLVSPKGQRDAFVKRFVDELEKRESNPSNSWFSKLSDKTNKVILIFAGIGGIALGLITLLLA